MRNGDIGRFFEMADTSQVCYTGIRYPHPIIEKGFSILPSPRIPFEKLTPIHPNRRISLETGPTPIAPRLIDLFVPLGFGQRALVVAPPKAASAVLRNFPEACLFL